MDDPWVGSRDNLSVWLVCYPYGGLNRGISSPLQEFVCHLQQDLQVV